MTLSMSEILTKVVDTKGRNAKIALLREHYSKPFAQVLAFGYDPRVVWQLPDSDPPYTAMPENEAQGILFSEARKLYLFVRGGNGEHINPTKREYIFIQLLEQVNPQDAKLLLACKNKKIPYNGITQKLIEEAWGEFNG